MPQRNHLRVAVFGIENGSVLTVVKRPCPKLLTASLDETAKIWDSAAGECLLTLFPHDVSRLVSAYGYGRLSHAVFSSDASTIIIVSDTTKLWHANTGVCLNELPRGDEVLSSFLVA